jgi:hypothetical protein
MPRGNTARPPPAKRAAFPIIAVAMVPRRYLPVALPTAAQPVATGDEAVDWFHYPECMIRLTKEGMRMSLRKAKIGVAVILIVLAAAMATYSISSATASRSADQAVACACDCGCATSGVCDCGKKDAGCPCKCGCGKSGVCTCSKKGNEMNGCGSGQNGVCCPISK